MIQPFHPPKSFFSSKQQKKLQMLGAENEALEAYKSYVESDAEAPQQRR